MSLPRTVALALTFALTLNASSRAAEPVPATSSPEVSVPVGELVEGLHCARDPSQTYTLYLPKGYPGNRRWPLLLILDPRGRSRLAAELFLAGAEEHGWILVSSNDTRSDGPMEPNERALKALWPEVGLRLASDPKRIYVAGFSGGAMLAWSLGRGTGGGVAGVIASGGRFEPAHYQKPIAFPTFGAAGDADFNYSEMRAVHRQLAKWGAPERLEIFHGPHQWMPEPLARLAIDWLELLAMRDGPEPRDDAWIARQWEQETAAARGLEAAGDGLAAQRRWQTIGASFAGLKDVAVATAEAKRLGKESATEKAAKNEKRWDDWAIAQLRDADRVIGELRTGSYPLEARQIVADLRLAELARRAQAATYEAVAAQRVRETLASRFGFYLAQELIAKGDDAGAALAMTVAAEVHPDQWVGWYNLACEQAKAGQRAAAFASLDRAVAAGMKDQKLAAGDADLASLHADPRFAAFLARLSPPIR
jgi:predicted esterase